MRQILPSELSHRDVAFFLQGKTMEKKTESINIHLSADKKSRVAILAELENDKGNLLPD